MENGDKIKVHERLATLEVQVKQIMVNHLPHIQKRVDWIFFTLLATLIATVANLISKA